HAVCHRRSWRKAQWRGGFLHETSTKKMRSPRNVSARNPGSRGGRERAAARAGETIERGQWGLGREPTPRHLTSQRGGARPGSGASFFRRLVINTRKLPTASS